jgi:hypothetical protein
MSKPKGKLKFIAVTYPAHQLLLLLAILVKSLCECKYSFKEKEIVKRNFKIRKEMSFVLVIPI